MSAPLTNDLSQLSDASMSLIPSSTSSYVQQLTLYQPINEHESNSSGYSTSESEPSPSFSALYKSIHIHQEKEIQEISEPNDDYAINVNVNVVMPLTAPADERNEGQHSTRLNWDVIFRHLAKNLPTPDYRLFFNILFGNCHHLQLEGRDPGRLIDKVEHKVRRDYGDTETLMFELFNQWKQLMGSSVSPVYIEQAFRERSNYLALQNFQVFMRQPPLLPSMSDRNRSKQLCPMMEEPKHDVQRNQVIYTTYMLPNMPQQKEFTSSNNREIVSFHNSNDVIIEEVEDRDTDLISLTSSSHSSPPLSLSSSFASSGDKMKRKVLQLNGDEEVPRKLRKTIAVSSNSKDKGNKGRRQMSKQAAIIELHDVTQSMISLTKRSLPLLSTPLETKQYDVFLEHTINSITKQTGESRHLVISLTHEAYCKSETFKTSKNDTFYFIYAETSCLVLREFEFENIRLYADFARKHLVRDILDRFGGNYKEPEALFLSFDGKPLLKKKKVNRPFKDENNRLKPLPLDENLPQRSTILYDRSESTVIEMGTEKPEDNMFGKELSSKTGLKVKTADIDSSSSEDNFMRRKDLRDKYQAVVHDKRGSMYLSQHKEVKDVEAKDPSLKHIEIQDSTECDTEKTSQADVLLNASFNENHLPSISFTSFQTESSVEKFGTHKNQQVSRGDVFCSGVDSTTCLGATATSALDSSHFNTVIYSCPPSSSCYPSTSLVAMIDDDSLSQCITNQDTHVVSSNDPAKVNENTENELDLPCEERNGYFESKRIKQEGSGPTSLRWVLRPSMVKTTRLKSLSESSLDVGTIPASHLISKQTKSSIDVQNRNVTVERVNKSNESQIDVIEKKMVSSTTIGVAEYSAENGLSNIDHETSF